VIICLISIIISTYFLFWLNLGQNLFFFKEASQAEPLAQTLEIIELSQAKGSKLINDRAELSRSSSSSLSCLTLSAIFADMQNVLSASSASINFQKMGINFHILVSKFDFTNLHKYLNPESSGGRILALCMSASVHYFQTPIAI
jgi:hypothetical protein